MLLYTRENVNTLFGIEQFQELLLSILLMLLRLLSFLNKIKDILNSRTKWNYKCETNLFFS